MEIQGNGVLLFGVRWLCGITMVSGILCSLLPSEMDVTCKGDVFRVVPVDERASEPACSQLSRISSLSA